MSDKPVIGVIGGMGPYAGLDLVRKIFDNTIAQTDQDHLPVALLSFPERICDRTSFLFGHITENPAYALAQIARQIESIGGVVAGIPCNTAHAPAILDKMIALLREDGYQIRIIHMIEEAVRFAQEEVPNLTHIGTLSTLAVYRLGMYRNTIAQAGFTPVVPDLDIEENLVNKTIFDSEIGIKAHANPVTPQARQNLLDAIAHLKEKGAQAVFLGCTELPLAIHEPVIDGVRIIDPTTVLARALIRETYPEKLKPLR